MTPQEQTAAIKKAEQEFLDKLEVLKKEYQSEIRTILKKIDQDKIDKIRQSLK